MKRMLIESSDYAGPVQLIFDKDEEIDALDATLPKIVESKKAFRIVDSRGVSCCMNPVHFIRSITIPENVKESDVIGYTVKP